MTTSPWFIHLYLFSLVPAPTALNLPAVRASASTQGKKGDVRDPQIRKKLYSEVVVSEWLRVHQRAILGGSAVPKTAVLPFCGSCAHPPPVHGLQTCFASSEGLDLTALDTAVSLVLDKLASCFVGNVFTSGAKNKE